MRAYSLGMMIVASTVGSQHVVILFLGFEGRAAGFWTCNLLKQQKVKYLVILRIVKNKYYIPAIWKFKCIWHSGNRGNDMSPVLLSSINSNITNNVSILLLHPCKLTTHFTGELQICNKFRQTPYTNNRFGTLHGVNVYSCCPENMI